MSDSLLVTYPALDNLFEPQNSELCLSTFGVGMYFDASNPDDTDADSWHDPAADLNLILSLRYRDIGTDDIQIGYSHDGVTETVETVVTKTDTGVWKWKHYSLATTARVDHTLYENFGNADFRLLCISELMVTNVTIKKTDTEARAEWKAPNSNASVEGEALTVGTKLSGWTINEGSLSADNGNVVFNSLTPFVGLGAATTFASGIGIWQGKDAGTYKWRVGDPANNNASWDGSTFAVKGTITALSGSIDGVLTIGTSGGIFQGTGTFGSPTTALKIYNSGGVGVLEMWGAGTKQVYFNTSGQLVAGGGNITLSSTALIFNADGSPYVQFKRGSNVLVQIYGDENPGTIAAFSIDIDPSLAYANRAIYFSTSRSSIGSQLNMSRTGTTSGAAQLLSENGGTKYSNFYTITTTSLARSELYSKYDNSNDVMLQVDATSGFNYVTVYSPSNATNFYGIAIGTNSVPNALLDVRGSAIFNEGGGDYDFRIEGDTNANLFFVDASTDRIGIKTASPNVDFEVNGTGLIPTLQGSVSSGGNLTLKSTSHATRGKIIFGNAATTAYDEVNERFGIGTSSPSGMIHAEGAPASGEIFTGIFTGANSVGSGASMRLMQDSGAAATTNTRLGYFEFHGAQNASHSRVIAAHVSAYAAEDWDATHRGASFGFYLTRKATTTRVNVLWLDSEQNVGLGGVTAFGASMVGGIALKNSTAPTGDVADQFALYSADQTAGNAAPHFRTENGSVVKLYQDLATTDLGVVLSNMGLRASGTAYPITTSGLVTFNGNVVIGDATSDTLTLTGRIASNVDFSADNTYDLGATNAARDIRLARYLKMTATATAGAAAGDIRRDSTRTASLQLYNGTRDTGINSVGYAPYAYPAGYTPTATVTTARNLAAVSGGNGGAVAIPIVVAGHMLLQSVTVRNTDTANARSAEWRLYEDRLDTSNTLDEIANANGTWSFTPGAASNRTSTPSSPPIYLSPGLYWLVIRNTSASQTFGIGEQAAGTMATNTAQTKSIAALGSTLDFVAATWTKITSMIGVQLEGRVFGQSSAF